MSIKEGFSVVLCLFLITALYLGLERILVFIPFYSQTGLFAGLPGIISFIVAGYLIIKYGHLKEKDKIIYIINKEYAGSKLLAIDNISQMIYTYE